jgi:hypothetical protein
MLHSECGARTVIGETNNLMTVSSLIISLLTYCVVASLIYLRGVAARSGLKQEKENWMVFGLTPVIIAGIGISKENAWASLLSLMTAIVGLVYHARLFIGDAKPTDKNEEPIQTLQRTLPGRGR